MSTQPVVLPVSGHAELHVSTRSGRVTITAEERQDLSIASDAPLREDKVEVDPTGVVSVKSGRGGSGWLEIRCPVGTDVAVGTVSGKVELCGQLGTARVATVNGSVDVERVEAVDVRSVSGSIEVASCSGGCRIQTTSGRATCSGSGDARVSTMSGGVQLENVAGSAKVQTASGKVELGMQGKGDVAVQTVSGAVKVEVPTGVRPATRLRSLSGKPRSDCDEGDDCEIAVQSLSGKIEVKCCS
jgi:DUF4097 and DUF4098 domain-containing protein YvlB